MEVYLNKHFSTLFVFEVFEVSFSTIFENDIPFALDFEIGFVTDNVLMVNPLQQFDLILDDLKILNKDE